MKSPRLYLAVVLMLIGLMIWWAKSNLPPAGVEIVEQRYDIRELLFDPDQLDMPAPPLDEFGFPLQVRRPGSVIIGGQTSTIALERQIFVRKLIEALERDVAPDSWKDRGGRIGEIVENAGWIVVRQTSANQDAMRALIEQKLARRAVQIMIEFRVMSGDAILEYVSTLPGEWQAVADGRVYRPYVDSALHAELVRRHQWQGGLSSPRIMVLDRQRAHTVIAVENAYYHSQPDPQKKPTVRVVPEGSYLDVRATTSDDRRFITLESKFRMNRLLQLEPTTQPTGDPASPWIMIPHVANGAIALSADVPNEMGLLVEVHPKRIPPEPGASDPPIFILMTPKLIMPGPAAQ